MELADRGGARAFQAMVTMRDCTRLNTFVFLPTSGGPRWPVILHRTPYGITASDARDKTDCTRAWLPSTEEPFRGSILRGWRNIVAHGMPPSTRIPAAATGLRARIGSTPTTRSTGTILSNGSPPSPGPIRWWGYPARPRVQPPPSPQPRRATLRGAVDRDGTAVAVGSAQHPGPLELAP